MALNVCDDRLSGWLQRPVRETVCRTRLRVDTTSIISRGISFHYFICRRETDVEPPIGTPLLIVPRGYIEKSFPQGNTSARQRVYDIRAFPLLGALSKPIVPHLPVCQS